MRRSAILAVGALFLAIGVVEAVVGSKKAAPVSASFRPWAGSFVSPSTGFVLGTEGCSFAFVRREHPCRAIVMGTSDGGTTWRRLATPPTMLQPERAGGRPASSVKGIAFADARNGWLFGPSLWTTHDGGGHWSRVTLKPQLLDVVASGGWAYAAVYGTTALLQSPIGHDDWRPVAVRAGGIWISGTGYAQLTASGASTWAGLAPQLPGPSIQLWRSVGGSQWRSLGAPCGTASMLALTATSANDLLLVCSDGSTTNIEASTDGGLRMNLTAQPSGMDHIEPPLAAPLGQTKTVVYCAPVAAGYSPPGTRSPSTGSWIYHTTNDGRTWTRTAYADHGAGFADLQFTSSTVGWVIHGYPGAAVDELLHTTDAGATFTPVAF